jgi:hypothetical protein
MHGEVSLQGGMDLVDGGAGTPGRARMPVSASGFVYRIWIVLERSRLRTVFKITCVSIEAAGIITWENVTIKRLDRESRYRISSCLARRVRLA